MAGHALVYDTDFYEAYCVLSEINKLVQTEKDEAAWRKLLELSMPLCEVHPFFGPLVKELSKVLYPNTVRDLYNYLKAYCLRLPLPIHKCKNCGRYFVVTGNITQDYCTRLMEGSEKTCRQMGAVVQYQSRQMKNPATREFTRSYKAHNARVRYGTMTKAEFTAWSKEARAKRADCVAGKLSLEDFVAWLDSDKQR